MRYLSIPLLVLAACSSGRGGPAQFSCEEGEVCVRGLIASASPTTVNIAIAITKSTPLPDDQTSVSTGDLDGDGDLDIVTAAQLGQALTLLSNDGAGNFSVSATIPSLNPVEARLVDLDGDGDLDIAAIAFSNRPAGTVVGPEDPTSVHLLFNDGLGAFPTDTRIDFQEQRFDDLALADVNGDGATDLIVLGWTGFNVLLNDGLGGFELAQERFGYNGIDTGGNVNDLTAGDFDGDGDNDIVVTRVESSGDGVHHSEIALYTNNGNGHFSGASVIAELGDALSVGVLRLDLNGDGHLDLVVSNWFTSADVLMNNGDGTFAPGAGIEMNYHQWEMSFADFDGDGDLDIVNPTGPGRGDDDSSDDLAQTGVEILLNNGAGQFPDRVAFHGFNAFDTAVGDLNGDGAQDVAVADLGDLGTPGMHVILSGGGEPQVTLP
jgi:hypothetical protein